MLEPLFKQREVSYNQLSVIYWMQGANIYENTIVNSF